MEGMVAHKPANDEACPESHFLSTFFRALSDAGVRYAVMRNYDALPYSSGGSDLDILVSPGDHIKVRTILFQSIQETASVPVGVAETVGFFIVYVLGRPVSNAATWWGLRVDLNVGLFFKGVPLVSEALLDSAYMYNRVSVLPRGIAGVLGVLKEILNNNDMPSRYHHGAREALESKRESVWRALSPMGHRALDLLHALITRGYDEKNVKTECRRLRRAIMLHAFKEKPIGVLQRRFLFEWSKVHRLFRPPGVMIAVLGVDGSGKSTVIEAIAPVLKETTHNALYIHHLRPSLLPPLARFRGKKSVQKGPVLEPHGATPSGVVGSLLRLSYLTLDYILGYWIKVRPIIAKQPAIVLFDRYAYDMAMDPRRFRIGVSLKVAKWFTKLVPKPDLILCITASPRVINARKQELPIEETKRQVDALQEFAQKEPRAIVVSNEGNVEKLRVKVLQTLYDFFRGRI